MYTKKTYLHTIVEIFKLKLSKPFSQKRNYINKICLTCVIGTMVGIIILVSVQTQLKKGEKGPK